MSELDKRLREFPERYCELIRNKRPMRAYYEMTALIADVRAELVKLKAKAEAETDD